MSPRRVRLTILPILLLLIATPGTAIDVPVEVYTLPNGLTVTLHEDHRLPQVVINTWFGVGSKDEPPGRSGFAHLFEHLMFMGTERVPGSEFDLIMERGGGANNASTNTDRTNYFSWGPSSLLPTLLWLDADRLEALGRAMTQDKLDLQRDIVRNERRQNYENTPYNKAYLMIPEAMYPKGHPYHYSTIGNHEDLEAATLEDVKEFFNTYYVPGNASLVVAGDFDPAAVKEVIAKTFGAIPARPLPEHLTAEPVRLERELRRMTLDRVESPKLHLVWHSPPAFDAGDADMDLIASILGDGPSSRLYRRLVLEEQIAREVEVFQWSRQLGSNFHIHVTAKPGGDLEIIKRLILDEIETFKAEGPSETELARVQAAQEARFLRQVENLLERADMLNDYRQAFGESSSFDRDLARWTSASTDDLERWANEVLTGGRLDLRILPMDASVEGADLDQRPEDFPAGDFTQPEPLTFNLANGVAVHCIAQPGSGLFSGALIADGGERLFPAERSGMASLAASMLSAGAGGRSAAEFADAVDALGASITASAGWHDLSVDVSGLSSKMEATLDLFADAVLRPSLDGQDFTRERELALDGIRSRPENPATVAFDLARALIFGREDPRGRPTGGRLETVEAITLAELEAAVPRLLDPSHSRFVFVGDFDPKTLESLLDDRFAAWRASGEATVELPPPVTEPRPGKLVVVDRADAPQTYIVLARPITAPADGGERAVRRSLNTLFGYSFTSRLNHNLREVHGYTYSAYSRLIEQAHQFRLVADASVQTEVTAAALTEFKREFDGLASGDVTEDELGKAVSTVRHRMTTSGGTTDRLAATLQGLVSNGRPLGALGADFAALDSVDLEGANRMARSGLYDWDSLLVVMVGDAEAVLPQLEAAGFPEPEILDVDGNPVPGTSDQ
jgi:predicted Zn-dependent peptidase